MTKKFLTGLRLVNLNSDPSVGSEGELYFNTSASVAKIYKSGAWSELGAGGGSSITVSTTEPVSPETGDAWYKNDTGELYIYDGTYWVEVNGTISLTQEQIQDYVAPLFTHNNHVNASVHYEDELNELHIEVTSAPTAGFTSTLKHDVKLNGSIAKGQAVYASSANGTNIIVSKASNTSEATSSKTLGLLETGGLNNAIVKVVTEGLLAGLNTSTATAGDPVWLGTDGNLIYGLVNKPFAPAHLVFIGIVTRVNSSNGEIFVKVQNGFELEEIHNIGIGYGASIQNNEVLAYNSASGFWVNKTADEAGLATSNSPTFTGSVSVETDIGSSGAYLDITNDIQTSIKSLNNSVVVSESVGITLNSGSGGPTKSLIFKNNGDLTFPDNSNQSTAFLGISSYSTTNISEGTNLYYTDERAQDAIGNILGSGLSYNDPTGVISNSGVLSVSGTINEISVSASAGSVTIGIPDSPIFVTPDIGVATATSINGTTIPSSKTLVVTTDIGSTVQAYDADLASIAALTGTSGFLKTNGSGTWSVDTATYSTSAHNHTLNSLSNVSINSLTDGQAIVWNSASSAWVNQLISGGGGATTTVSETAPATPSTGDSWYKPSTGSFFIYDGSYWVEVTSVITMTDEEAQDKIAPLFNHASHVNMSASYDDGNNKIILASTDTLSSVTSRGATTSNAISITNATESTSTSTGALIVSGGLGVGKDVWIEGNLHVAGTTVTENTQTVATHDNMIYLNAAFDTTITNAVFSSGSITYTADNSYVAGMDIRITGVDPAGFNISSGDGLTVASATPTQFIVVKSDPGASYVSGGTAHAKTEVNPDLGFAGGYYSAGYAHAGLFRDASDGIFKFFDGYTPEPDEAVNIDTGHVSFSFAPLKAESLDVVDASTTRTNLGLAIGSNVQAYNSTLAAVAGGTYTGDDSITTVGTISSGTWNGTAIGYPYGGTGLTTLGTAGQVLTVNAGATAIEWATPSGGGGPSTTTTSITTNSATAIESFATATSRTAEAIIQITQGTDYYSSKVLLIHDGTTVKMTEYAILESTTGAIPLTISSAISGSNVELRATITDAATTNATAKVIMTEVAV